MACSLQWNNTSQDEQEHLLFCKTIFAQLDKTEAVGAQKITYNDIYGTLQQQKDAVCIFIRLLDLQNRLLQKDTVTTPTSETTLDTATLPSQGSDGDYQWKVSIMWNIL